MAWVASVGHTVDWAGNIRKKAEQGAQSWKQKVEQKISQGKGIRRAL